MIISMALIYFALVFQFDSAVKPLLVFGAIPYGMCGALAMLAIMHQPFGFMAFLGVASLIGVIVSHVIVLFDFIEEAHHHGRDLEDALIEAGIVRLRPVMITVGATVLGLIPLAMHGGPLWEPLCYAQIGGLSIATVITLVLVPLMYTVFVRDSKSSPGRRRPRARLPRRLPRPPPGSTRARARWLRPEVTATPSLECCPCVRCSRFRISPCCPRCPRGRSPDRS